MPKTTLRSQVSRTSTLDADSAPSPTYREFCGELQQKLLRLSDRFTLLVEYTDFKACEGKVEDYWYMSSTLAPLARELHDLKDEVEKFEWTLPEDEPANTTIGVRP